jgi:hypothetical protein
MVANILHMILQGLRMIGQKLCFCRQNLVILWVEASMKLRIINLIGMFLELSQITLMLPKHHLLRRFHQELLCQDLFKIVLFFELAHKLHVLKRVDLELRQLVVETALTHLDGLGDVRLERELLARGLAVHVAWLSQPQKVTVAQGILDLVEPAALCEVARLGLLLVIHRWLAQQVLLIMVLFDH